MSDLIICGVEEEEKFRLEKLIKIQCLVKDCNFEKAFIPIHLIINIDQLGDERLIQYLCTNHYSIRNAINNNNILNKQITFCQQLVIKPLKFGKSTLPYEMMLRKAEIKLDKNSCCLRENIKYFNMKQVQTILELISNDDQLILGLVKRVLIEKYIEFLEIKNEINKALKSNKINILKYFTLQHRYNQILNQISCYLKQNIKESAIILQPLRGIKDTFQQKLMQQEND